MSPISSIVFSFATLMVITAINGAHVNIQQENEQDLEKYSDYPVDNLTLSMKERTYTIRVPLGSSFNLGCQSEAYPAPALRWIHLSTRTETVVQEAAIYRTVFPLTSTSLVDLHSNITVDCAQLYHAGVYICESTPRKNGHFFQKVHVIVEDKNGENKTSCDTKTAPHIITYAKVFIDESRGHVDAYLPCTVVGNPTPRVYWVHNKTKQNFEVGFSSDKYKVHPNGALQILDFDLADMGNYICVAKNEVGKSSITTHVLPLRPKKA